MEGENRRGGWLALWSAVLLLAVFVVYPLSTGPAAWLHSKTGYPLWILEIIYGPFDWVLERSPDWVGKLFVRYMRLWT